MRVNNNDIRILVNSLAKKERQGALTFPQFNSFMVAEDRNHFDYHFQFYERNQKSSDTLSPFKEIKQEQLSQSGSVSDDLSLTLDAYIKLPSDYAHLIPGSIMTGEGYPVEKLTDAEWYNRMSQTIKQPTTKNPFCVFQNGYIRIAPTTIDSVEFAYLRYPNKPYLDGYIDSNGDFVYLEEDESVDLDAEGGTTLDGTSSGTYDSKTVEMEWKMEDKLEIAARILNDYGVSIDKPTLWKYNEMMRKEDQ